MQPGISNGVRGKTALLAYFRKLLAYNPALVWTQLEAFPMEGGFLNKWLAEIPVDSKTTQNPGPNDQRNERNEHRVKPLTSRIEAARPIPAALRIYADNT